MADILQTAFSYIFLNESVGILIKIITEIPKGPIDNK